MSLTFLQWSSQTFGGCHGLKIIERPAVQYFSIFLFEIQNIYTKCSTLIQNRQALLGSQKFRTWCFSPTPYTEYNVIQALDTYKIFNDTTGHGPQITSYFSLKYTNYFASRRLTQSTVLNSSFIESSLGVVAFKIQWCLTVLLTSKS